MYVYSSLIQEQVNNTVRRRLLFVDRQFLSLNYNEMRTKMIIAHTFAHMCLFLFIGLYVIKYQPIAHFRVWVGAYSRGGITLSSCV